MRTYMETKIAQNLHEEQELQKLPFSIETKAWRTKIFTL
jgi:hypothetical protein